jgi:hypothetical protein
LAGVAIFSRSDAFSSACDAMFAIRCCIEFVGEIDVPSNKDYYLREPSPACHLYGPRLRYIDPYHHGELGEMNGRHRSGSTLAKDCEVAMQMLHGHTLTGRPMRCCEVDCDTR